MDIAMLALHSSPLDALGARDAGGMSVVLRELSAALARRGHRVDVFTCRGGAQPGNPEPLALGVRLVRLGARGAASVPKESLHRHAADAASELVRFAADAGRAYDLVHSHYWVSGVAGQAAARVWGVPHVITFHTLGAVKSLLSCGEDEPSRRLVREGELASAAHRVVVPSAREAELLGVHCGVHDGRLAVVPWGVDRGWFTPGDRLASRVELGLAPEDPVLLFVGRFAPVKGLDLLLGGLPEVARCHPRVRLLVAGGEGRAGENQAEALAWAGDPEIAGRVSWLGRVAREGLPQLYRAADSLVVPSRYESFGLVALEALACGAPVVATRVGVMDEVVREGRNGRLAEAPTSSALAQAIRSQLEAEPADPEAVRASVAGWSWERAAAATESVYREVVEDAT